MMFKLFCHLVFCAVLSSCAGPPETGLLRPLGADAQALATTRLDALLPMDVLLLGEQHDASEHQQIHQHVIALLAQRSLLGAVALEMADAGVSSARLDPSATEQEVKNTLKWNTKSWPWEAYGPAVMTAIRAGVLVVGANLPRESMRISMSDSTLDGQLPGAVLKAQQQQIRIGHCNMLPESQITPMTRIQIAKDLRMAKTLREVALPGKAVVLLAGSGHADRLLGVPQHLPASLTVKAIRLLAGGAAAADKTDAFDAVWPTPALPEKDYCAAFKAQMAQ